MWVRIYECFRCTVFKSGGREDTLLALYNGVQERKAQGNEETEGYGSRKHVRTYVRVLMDEMPDTIVHYLCVCGGGGGFGWVCIYVCICTYIFAYTLLLNVEVHTYVRMCMLIQSNVHTYVRMYLHVTLL